MSGIKKFPFWGLGSLASWSAKRQDEFLAGFALSAILGTKGVNVRPRSIAKFFGNLSKNSANRIVRDFFWSALRNSALVGFPSILGTEIMLTENNFYRFRKNFSQKMSIFVENWSFFYINKTPLGGNSSIVPVQASIVSCPEKINSNRKPKFRKTHFFYDFWCFSVWKIFELKLKK